MEEPEPQVDLYLTIGWLPLRLQNTIGGGIPGMEPMFFGILSFFVFRL